MPYQPKPGVCDCSETPLLEEEAIILFPSLGTPLLLAPGQVKASIFIAAPSSMRGKAKAAIPTGEAVEMYRLVDQHLRVVDLASKQEAEQAEGSTQTGTLFGDGMACAAAKPCIKAWLVGSFGPGALVSDRHGRPFATIAPAAAQIYTKVQDVYEVELDLSAPPFADLQTPGAMKSLAWMIRLGTEDRKLEAFKGVKYAEAQDLAIARFLQQQAARDPWHFDKLHEFAMPPPDVPFSWSKPGQRPELDTLLKSWHPVKRMTKSHLKLGHLSDVHINMRQNAMGRSDAKVLEGADEKKATWNRPVGSKVCNSFEALKKLFETMATGSDQVDAVLLTGDLIDYNRNFNPMAEPGGPGRIGEQWKAFNLLGNVFDKEKGRRLYPRGLDDMMVFSLVREMYRNPAYQLPIIMTSGNHEAYQVPYGISARVEAGDQHNWAFMLGVLETTTPNSRDARKRMEENARTSWPDGNVPAEARRAQRALAQPDAVERHRAQFEAASAWTRGKANEGMSRDHNMTIYEACLAYGPTYGHALTGYNFDGGQFDWFYALFTPLADVVYAYGAESTDKPGAKAGQVIAALGWGIDENFKNLLGVADWGVDRQGPGILPRATESFSHDQLKLLTQARSYKAASEGTLTVATHFTIVSFDEPEPFSNLTKKKDRVFFHPCNSATGVWGMKAALNHVNVGTCEKNQATYLAQYVQPMDQAKASPTPKVDWHLSGHSHRSGVYKLGWNPRSIDTSDGWRVEVREAKDPGIHNTQTVKPNTVTALIVSSCGGPIGYQNLDGELSAWTGRPPAGTTLDPTTGEIRQVKTDRCHVEGKFQGKGFNEKPRLAVALDYLHAMSGLPKKGNIRVPLRFKPGYFAKSGQLELVLSEQVRKLGCVVSVTLWVFEKNKKSGAKQWHRIESQLNTSTLGFKNEDKAKLLSMMEAMTLDANGALAMAWSPKSVIESNPNAEYVTLSRRLVQSFCEVTLSKPVPTDAGEDWAKDMLHADPWVFPLDIALIDGNVNMGGFSLNKSDPAHPKNAAWYFGRPMGERGEVPDWDFLSDNFASKGYVDKKSAIWVNKDAVR
ncbi:metallophosphoesterase [Variovorax sp. YR752]|uniref:metallophosphoesterase n=1 Tax=Variovorax sp. YR752 TaxID=1884383 RepID=UPI0031379EC0